MPYHLLPRLRHMVPYCSASIRLFSSGQQLQRAFQEGEVVLLKDKRGDYFKDGFLFTLQASKTCVSHRGIVKHEDIIGKEPRQIVQSSKGCFFRIHDPTLAEYVRLTPRLVTPIYPFDANLIVSLLDLHVDTPSDPLRSEPPLEILEAGTGHGALTLHLSRAIHAANAPRPKALPIASEQEPEDTVYLGESMADLQDTAMQTWLENRRAIVHTLDISSRHSEHAQKIVKGFRGGMYQHNVDFHVGDVSDWIEQQKTVRETTQPFLSHVFLDLPTATQYLADVAPVLQVNGILAVFNPSITQIMQCVEKIREEKMPYLLDQIVELGAATIREWDVRSVRPKATRKKNEARTAANSPSDEATSQITDQVARDDELAQEPAQTEEDRVMVCRPKVGQFVVGGGFLGLWRRMEQTATLEQETEAP